MTEIDYASPMDSGREDSAGYVPDFSLIGTSFTHWKTERTYRVTGFVWDGERDLWLIKHVDQLEQVNRGVSDPEPTEFVRSYVNFFEYVVGVENHDTGVQRMMRVYP